MLGQVEYRYGPQAPGRHTGSFLFVVSHMRSFSSLLCHILGSHPEISGYAEAHLSYFGRLDLQRLARKVQHVTGNPSLGRYVLDKVLHNRREIAPDVLTRPEIKVVFLLRNAEDTFPSLMNMRPTPDAPKARFSDPLRALDYYATRLSQLERYGALVDGNGFFLESEKLLGDTDCVLSELSRWLGLRQQLNADYRTFPFTGAPGYGDPLPTIRSGRIVRDAEERHRHYVATSIPDELMRKGVAAHAACRDRLVRHAPAPLAKPEDGSEACPA